MGVYLIIERLVPLGNLSSLRVSLSLPRVFSLCFQENDHVIDHCETNEDIEGEEDVEGKENDIAVIE